MSPADQTQALAEGQQQIAREVLLWLAWLRRRLRHFTVAWVARRRRASEMRDLYRFSDRELWDVGLSRADLPAIARGRYRRE
jgi:uncharacterized protein YjiS (DUF1127 family)